MSGHATIAAEFKVFSLSELWFVGYSFLTFKTMKNQ